MRSDLKALGSRSSAATFEERPATAGLGEQRRLYSLYGPLPMFAVLDKQRSIEV